jgi:MoxR-like ATPase
MPGEPGTHTTPQKQKRRCRWQTEADYPKAFCVLMKRTHLNRDPDRKRSVWNSTS